MDYLMAVVTEIPEVAIGDEVLIFGEDSEEMLAYYPGPASL